MGGFGRADGVEGCAVKDFERNHERSKVRKVEKKEGSDTEERNTNNR